MMRGWLTGRLPCGFKQSKEVVREHWSSRQLQKARFQADLAIAECQAGLSRIAVLKRALDLLLAAKVRYADCNRSISRCRSTAGIGRVCCLQLERKPMMSRSDKQRLDAISCRLKLSRHETATKMVHRVHMLCCYIELFA